MINEKINNITYYILINYPSIVCSFINCHFSRYHRNCRYVDKCFKVNAEKITAELHNFEQLQRAKTNIIPTFPKYTNRQLNVFC